MSATSKAWIEALRLRTLPLALSCVVVANGLAYYERSFSWSILGLTVLTTVLLQVLSNLANDYGDGVKGTDDKRIGPSRGVQSGLISPAAMKRATIAAALLSFVSGLTLLWLALGEMSGLFFLFLVFGLASIGAAVKYTVGRRSYGYVGLGDLFVFLFFGLLGVMGSYYLQTNELSWLVLFPAITVGALSVGVLNVNNIRDRQTDMEAGKRTIAVLLGDQNARRYHITLLTLAVFSLIVFIRLSEIPILRWVMVLAIALLYVHGKKVWKSPVEEINPQLKQLALSTFGISVAFSATLVWLTWN